MAWNIWPFKKRSGRGSNLADPVVLKRVEKTLSDKIRRFEVADSTDRNHARWCRSDDRTINQILVAQLRVMHERCAYEVRNNAIVDGTIGTHARDCVGSNGPSIQVDGPNDGWAQKAERVIKDWSESVTADGRSSLGDWLRDDIRDWWQIGDMLAQIVEPDDVDGVRLRVHPLDARGLVYSNQTIPAILGVQRNKYRKPINYYITEVEDQRGYRKVQPSVLPARDVLHDFTTLERGQIRGFPLMTPTLDVISELREYDTTVMRAAKVQALMSVLMQAIDETAQADENPEPFELNDGGITRMPVGWKGTPMGATQPMDNNTEFRSERLRDLGSPAGMPLMKIKHDSSKHNYSSARFDAGSYNRACQVIQNWLYRRRVKPLVSQVLVDAMMFGILPVRSLRNVSVIPSWEQPPHADPVKEAMAGRIRLESRQSSPITEARAHGNDFETICKEWKRANELLEANGMPPMLGAIPGTLTDLENYLNEDPDDGENTENRPTQGDN